MVGFGPCGMFAALVLAQMGFKPIVLERGKPVRQRTKDTWGLWRKNTLNPESNVQFGEGGAGTFSDGKLYSQIKDPRFLGRKVMDEFVLAGAPPEILYEAHPHIGTFKLVKVVESIREQIIALGGEVRFEQRVSDVLLNQEHSGKQVLGLQVENLQNGSQYALPARHVVMALGHSSRDTFAMLHERGVDMQAKPFSVGFRIEHPQGVIDRARWGRHAGHPLLGAADYKLVHHAAKRACCLQLLHVPWRHRGGRHQRTGPRGHQRHEPVFAQRAQCQRRHGGGHRPARLPARRSRLCARLWRGERQALCRRGRSAEGTRPTGRPPACRASPFSASWRSGAYTLGGGTYEAPGQLVGDFIAAKPSTELGSVTPSYKPGVKLGDLAPSLPGYAIAALREALPAFAKKIKGFDMADAVLTGVETRTSITTQNSARGRPAKHQCAGPVPGGRRRLLCGRDLVGGGGWDQGGGGDCAGHCGRCIRLVRRRGWASEIARVTRPSASFFISPFHLPSLSAFVVSELRQDLKRLDSFTLALLAHARATGTRLLLGGHQAITHNAVHMVFFVFELEANHHIGPA